MEWNQYILSAVLGFRCLHWKHQWMKSVYSTPTHARFSKCECKIVKYCRAEQFSWNGNCIILHFIFGSVATSRRKFEHTNIRPLIIHLDCIINLFLFYRAVKLRSRKIQHKAVSKKSFILLTHSSDRYPLLVVVVVWARF